jgi:FkbM family methyltransferase
MIGNICRRAWAVTTARIEVISSVLSHPLNRGSKGRALWDYFVWNVARFSMDSRQVVRMPEGIDLIVGRRENYATGVYVHSLPDFWEMLFFAHLLRSNDLFADVGANVGMYSLWVARTTGARVIAVEPVAETYGNLRKNIRLNELDALIEPMNTGVGDLPGEFYMSESKGGMNHVLQEPDEHSVAIPVRRLDDIFSGSVPVAMKMDVEGFEMRALKGATRLLQNTAFKALLIELQDRTLKRYGTSAQEVRSFLEAQGFVACIYKPIQRKLVPITAEHELNVIFVKRNDAEVATRIAEGRKIRLSNFPQGV